MAENHLNYPHVSIIIPVYNSERYIINTLLSVIHQTYQNIEIIIVNDGSTDNTLKVIEQELSDSRIQIINQTNKGASAARNTGFLQSKGSYIKFLDGDDQLNLEMIEQQVALAMESTDCIISAQWGRFYNNDVITFKLNPEDCWQTMPATDWICSSWKNTSSMTTPGIFLIPKEIIKKAGLWDENLSLLDDTEYFTRTILVADMVIFSSRSILYYNSGIKSSLSGFKTRKGFESAFTAIEKATTAFLNKKNNKHTQLLCANFWQLFIYDSYPYHKDLLRKAKKHLQKLEKASLPFPCGGYSKLLLPFLGWKTTKRLQLINKKILKTYNKTFSKTQTG